MEEKKAMEKQLPEDTGVIDALPETCTACHFWWGSMDQPGGMCEITGDETDTESGVWDERRMDNCPIEELEENMRKILFKAKRKDNGEWVEGFIFEIKGKFYIMKMTQTFMTAYYSEESVVDFNMRAVEIDPDTLCQYTGLTDKNGKKIWENDIVEVPGEEGYFVCEWDEDTARFVLNGDRMTVDFDNYWAYEIEVVGNIFDNPDLLEVE